MNFKSKSILLVFTLISISVLCDAYLDDSDETFEDLEDLTKTYEERGSGSMTAVTINATYTCDANSFFALIVSAANTITVGGTDNPPNPQTFVVNRTNKCTSLTKGNEPGFYVARPNGAVAGTLNVALIFPNLKTEILRVNGKEILTQIGIVNNTGTCVGAKVILHDTITQTQNVNVNGQCQISSQMTNTAVFKIKNKCQSNCTGTITYTYNPPLTKTG